MSKTERGLEKYLRAEDADLSPILPVFNNGKDITRRLISVQVRKFLDCKLCQEHPVVYFNFKMAKGKQICVGVCADHWIKLSDTVIGWESS